jgi:DNA-binding response OmpR family regulator
MTARDASEEKVLGRLRHKLDAAGCTPRSDTVRGTGYRFSH